MPNYVMQISQTGKITMGPQDTSPRQYAPVPETNQGELAGLIFDAEDPNREGAFTRETAGVRRKQDWHVDIPMHHEPNTNFLTVIPYVNAAYFPLHYPILFVSGNHGWNPSMPLIYDIHSNLSVTSMVIL